MTQPFNDVATFAEWLERRRRALDLTIEELAELVGYAGSTLQKIEHGIRRPSRELAEHLAMALDIPSQERPRFLALASIHQPEAVDQESEVSSHLRPARNRSVLPSVTLVGRDSERTALVERLRVQGQRLVTLVGPGGIGKTSLALQVAADLAADTRFPDGVAVAFLAPVVAAEDVPLAIGDVLGIATHGARPAVDQLIDALADRSLLLVLDNLEHLLGPHEGAILTRLVGRILTEAPAVCLLATSRERLRMRDERVIDVSGLALPPSNTGVRVERSAAVQLFVERAQRVAATFTIGPDNRIPVAHICRRLEGLPLAIELAASWVRALTPHEIAAQIDHSLDFLTRDDRDTPDRHRSVRAALDHSWRLLDDAERHTLARLSIFHGGCDREALNAVIGTTLPIITSLIDKSLVRATASGGVTYYTLHELVRQYAAEQLAADPVDEQATAMRHATYYADLLQRSIAAQTGGASPEVWTLFPKQIDNLRAAWTWAATNGDSNTVTRMTLGLTLVYDLQGWLLDGATLFGRAAELLRASSTDTVAARGLVIGWQGYFLYRAGRLQEASQQLEQGIALLQAVNSQEYLANLLLHLGAIEIFSARLDKAQAHHAKAVQCAEQVGDYFTIYWVRFFQGLIALVTGNYPLAEQHLTACLEVWRSQGFSRGIVGALVFLGEVVRLQGRPAEAEASIRESLRISSAIRDHLTIAASLRELGALALERGELDEARYLLTESYEGMRAFGDVMYAGRSQSLLVRLEAEHGKLAAARQGCAELLRSAREGPRMLLVEGAYGLALTLASEANRVEALAVLIALDGTVGEYSTLALAKQLRTELEQRLDAAEQMTAHQLAQGKQLVPWLEELCARLPVVAVSPSLPVVDKAIVPNGALYVPETEETLSPREIQVLRLMIGGASNQAIADTLIISLHTAKKHVARVLDKIGVATRTQAALRGRALGLAPLSPNKN